MVFRRVGRSEAETHLPAKWWVSLRSTHPTFDPFWLMYNDESSSVNAINLSQGEHIGSPLQPQNT